MSKNLDFYARSKTKQPTSSALPPNASPHLGSSSSRVPQASQSTLQGAAGSGMPHPLPTALSSPGVHQGQINTPRLYAQPIPYPPVPSMAVPVMPVPPMHPAPRAYYHTPPPPRQNYHPDVHPNRPAFWQPPVFRQQTANVPPLQSTLSPNSPSERPEIRHPTSIPSPAPSHSRESDAPTTTSERTPTTAKAPDGKVVDPTVPTVPARQFPAVRIQDPAETQLSLKEERAKAKRERKQQRKAAKLQQAAEAKEQAAKEKAAKEQAEKQRLEKARVEREKVEAGRLKREAEELERRQEEERKRQAQSDERPKYQPPVPKESTRREREQATTSQLEQNTLSPTPHRSPRRHSSLPELQMHDRDNEYPQPPQYTPARVSPSIPPKPSATDYRRLEKQAAQKRYRVELLESQITKAAAEIAAVEAKLMRDRAALEELQAEHANLLTSLEQDLRLMNRFRGFTKELLCKVFLYCVEDEGTGGSGSKPVAIVLSQVCQEWRTIVVSTPDLWQSVNLDFKSGGDLITMLSHWFELSSNVPLTISLTNVPETESKRVNIAMDYLLLAANRWKKLSIFTERGDAKATILRRLTVPTPRLTSLRVYGASEHFNAIPNDFLPDAPLLHTIAMKNFSWPSIPRRFPALRRLQLLWPNVDEGNTLDEFSKFHALQTLDARVHWRDNQRIPAPFSFASVTTLTLNFSASQHFANAKTPIAFPNLQDLTFDFLLGTDDMQLLFFFLRYLPQPELLRRLVLIRCDDGSGDPARIEEIKRAFVCATGLQEICLDSCGFNDRLLSLFTHQVIVEEVPRWVCPQLQHLEIAFCRNITGDALAQLINSRRKASRGNEINRPQAISSATFKDRQGVLSWRPDQA